eukprot:Lithocolla_globosa_v1_NODE_8_length_11455_cov_155.660175.p8 type:complete len:125 gc:universal NODE_8_length_11455_cov_155.660175:9757-10131(+)
MSISINVQNQFRFRNFKKQPFSATKVSPGMSALIPRLQFNTTELKFQCSSNRLLLLDYDGALVEYKSLPHLAILGPKLLGSVRKLTEDDRNHVVVLSSRTKDFLDLHFGGILTLRNWSSSESFR